MRMLDRGLRIGWVTVKLGIECRRRLRNRINLAIIAFRDLSRRVQQIICHGVEVAWKVLVDDAS